jgi:hypothetical protein
MVLLDAGFSGALLVDAAVIAGTGGAGAETQSQLSLECIVPKLEEQGTHIRPSLEMNLKLALKAVVHLCHWPPCSFCIRAYFAQSWHRQGILAEHQRVILEPKMVMNGELMLARQMYELTCLRLGIGTLRRF